MNRNEFFALSYFGPPLCTDTSSMVPEISEERQTRRSIIEPVYTLLRNGELPTGKPLNSLTVWLNLMKEEGNDFYTSKDFFQAYDMYTAAIMIGNCIVDQTQNPAFNDQLMAAVLSNRALCLLKMDYVAESIEDSRTAIGLDPTYFKAYYRLACGLKTVGDHQTAYQVAVDGKMVVEKIKLASYVKDFQVLICEIEEQMMAQDCSESNATASYSPTACYKKEMSGSEDSVELHKRTKRWEKIYPMLDCIRNCTIPHGAKADELKHLMVNLQEEANLSLNERDYKTANQLFTDILVLAKYLQVVRFETVDSRIISAMFFKRAGCRLKLEIFDGAVEDCDLAIGTDKNNLEALVRKARALMSMKNFSESLKITEECKSVANATKNMTLVKICEDLLVDIKSQLKFVPGLVFPMANQPSLSEKFEGPASDSSTDNSENAVVKKKRNRSCNTTDADVLSVGYSVENIEEIYNRIKSNTEITVTLPQQPVKQYNDSSASGLEEVYNGTKLEKCTGPCEKSSINNYGKKEQSNDQAGETGNALKKKKVPTATLR